MDPIFEKVSGSYGVAEPVPIPENPLTVETVAHWLVTSAPMVYHPFFVQWVLAAVRLRDDIPGFPPPKRHFEGTTHEIMCVTLNPEDGPQDVDRILGYVETGGMPWLMPPSIAVQVIATDEEVRDVVSLCAQSVVHGHLSPESLWTAGRDRALNDRWLTAIVKSLAHARGELHAP